MCCIRLVYTTLFRVYQIIVYVHCDLSIGESTYFRRNQRASTLKLTILTQIQFWKCLDNMSYSGTRMLSAMCDFRVSAASRPVLAKTRISQNSRNSRFCQLSHVFMWLFLLTLCAVTMMAAILATSGQSEYRVISGGWLFAPNDRFHTGKLGQMVSFQG